MAERLNARRDNTHAIREECVSAILGIVGRARGNDRPAQPSSKACGDRVAPQAQAILSESDHERIRNAVVDQLRRMRKRYGLGADAACGQQIPPC